MILLAVLAGAVIILIAAILIPGALTDRAQRADSRQPRHRDTSRDVARLREHAARRHADNVIPRAHVKGSPPWPVQPLSVPSGPVASASRGSRETSVSPAGPGGAHPWPVQPTLPPAPGIILTASRDISEKDMAALKASLTAVERGNHKPVSGQPAGKDGSRCDSGAAVGSREPAPPVATDRHGAGLAARYRRIFPGDVPGEVAAILGHGGPREQAVDAAVESCFTKAMARQVKAALAVSGDG